jgi:hypothetical protein
MILKMGQLRYPFGYIEIKIYLMIYDIGLIEIISYLIRI